MADVKNEVEGRVEASDLVELSKKYSLKVEDDRELEARVARGTLEHQAELKRRVVLFYVLLVVTVVMFSVSAFEAFWGTGEAQRYGMEVAKGVLFVVVGYLVGSKRVKAE